MRLTRLQLSRYGHLSDADLVFDPAMPLHIVLGANEAGKSTALSAIADALFGFGHKTSFAFLHRQQDLRLGIGVQAADGRAQFFLRRKGRQETLRDADDAVLPESAIGSFLAGASRERFTETFGMDGSELRRGGAAILKGDGEVGTSIMQAFAGPQNLRGALGRLNEAALELYGDRRGGRAFHTAAEAFRTARQDVETRSVRPADYDQAAQDRTAIQTARAANARESERLEAERARLDRIRRTTPARLAFMRDRDARLVLGDIASLPPDAEVLRTGAMQARTLLGLEQARALEAQGRDAAALQAIDVNEAVLGAGDAIDALAADLNRIESAARDRETQGLEVAQARRRVVEHGERLGLKLDAEILAQRLPGIARRAEAQRALTEYTSLAARRQQLAMGLEQAEDAAIAARTRFEALAEPAPMEALVAAVEAAQSEGRIDLDFADAEDAVAAARGVLARALAALPFWEGSAEALANAPVPLAADFAEREAALTAAQEARAERQRELARIDQVLQSIEADLAGVLAAGAPPTAEAIGRARDRRDRAWQVIRAVHVAHGPPPPQDELADLPADLAGAFAGLITEADSLADRRTDEAERVAAYEQLLSNQARLRVARVAEAASVEAAESDFRRALEAWQAAWQPAGIAPGDPARMREFLARREAIARLLDDATAKQRQVTRLGARRAAVLDRLSAVMPGLAGDQLAPQLQAASLRRKDVEAAQKLYADAKRLAGEKQAALAEQERKRQALDGAMSVWWAAWAPIADALGLAEGEAAEAGAEALAVWADIERHARDMRAARRRVAEMTADIDAFAARVAAVCTGCAADLAGDAPSSAVRALNARLARHRSAEAERTKLRRDSVDRATNLASLGEQMAEAADILAALRAVAGVDDDEALQAAIARAHQAALLDAAMDERARELRRLDDGLTLDQLALEAAGEAHDLLPGRIAEIEARQREIAAENEGFASRLRDLETRIAAMERGHDAAEAAQRMRNAAAEAEEIAARYVRLRLSHSLLRAGIERFRRERQAPLLAAAGEVFAALTEGRYASLAVEEAEDARMVVVALRPDGLACPADRLSEGARDQLYLALRLAAIRGHAAQTEPLPFIADDLLASFDDNRARATLRVLAAFGAVTQTILFTHHGHIADMADPATTQVLRLAAA